MSKYYFIKTTGKMTRLLDTGICEEWNLREQEWETKSPELLEHMMLHGHVMMLGDPFGREPEVADEKTCRAVSQDEFNKSTAETLAKLTADLGNHIKVSGAATFLANKGLDQKLAWMCKRLDALEALRESPPIDDLAKLREEVKELNAYTFKTRALALEGYAENVNAIARLAKRVLSLEVWRKASE